MPLGTRLTDLLHELLNKCPNPTGNQEFIFCHDPCGPASREILRVISKAGGGSICTSHRASLGADPFSMGCRRKSWCPVRRATRCSANHRCHSSVRTYFSTPVPVLEFGRNHARCRGP